MRILATLVAALAVALVVGLTPASAQSPGRNGLIYFTTPDLVDSPPDCGVASTTETGRGYGCIDLGDAFDMTVSRAPHRLLLPRRPSRDPDDSDARRQL